MPLPPQLCPHCALDLHAIASQHLAFCPRCQFPVKILANKYRLEWKIAAGGFGVVYFATAQNTTDKVVVKLVKRELFDTPEAGIRFQREIMITEALSSSNEHIVRYLDHGEDPELGHFYVMEYLDGIALNEYLDKHNAIPYTDCFHIFRQICEALAIAHRQGVVHRDLKPENIFLVRHEDDPLFVKVLDFGIAKIIAGTTQASLTKGIIGTPNYLSPEQCLDGNIDGRSDIYSMGIILYELLTRLPVFPSDHEAMMSLLFRHINEIPTPMRNKRPDLHIPEELDQVVLRALAKDPKDRYQNISEFWAALRPFAFLPIRANVVQTSASTLSPAPAPQETAKAYEPTVDFRGNVKKGFAAETPLPTPKRELRQAPFLHESPQAVSKSPRHNGPKILSKSPKVDANASPTRKDIHTDPKNSGKNVTLYIMIVLILLSLVAVLSWFSFYRKKNIFTDSSIITHTEPAVLSDAGTVFAGSSKNNPPPSVLEVPDHWPPQRNIAPTNKPQDENDDQDDDQDDDSPASQPPSHRKPQPSVRTPVRQAPKIKRPLTRHHKPAFPAGPCGQNTATSAWIRAYVSRPKAAQVKVIFYSCPSCRTKQQGFYHCLSIPKNRSQVRLRIKAEGYQSCRISVSTKQPRLRWTLRIFDPDSLIDESYPCSSPLP